MSILSAFLHRRCSSWFLWLCSGSSPAGPCLSYPESPRGECSTAGGVSLSRGPEPLLILLDTLLAQPGVQFAFWSACAQFLDCIQFLIHQYSQILPSLKNFHWFCKMPIPSEKPFFSLSSIEDRSLLPR